MSPTRSLLTSPLVCLLALSSLTISSALAAPSSKASKASDQAPAPSSERPTEPSADFPATLQPAEPEAPRYVAPVQARFQVLSIHLMTPLDGRRLSPERTLTLSLMGELPLMESFWANKRLSLFREVVIPSPVEGVPPGVRHEPLGFARIESVRGNILQARVEVDALLKPRNPDGSESLVVQIGDSAQLFVEPAPPPKPKPKRRRKRKPKSPFVRDKMKWRL